MVKKIAVLGFVSGFALFLYGRKLLRPTPTLTVVRADGSVVR